MATGVSTFNDITPALRDSYKRVLLDRAKKDLVFMQNADKATIDANSGDHILYRRYEPYPVVTTPITDGVIGAPRKPTYTQPRAELDYYGDYSKITKRTVKTNLEDVTAELMDVHGQQAGETIDTLMREVLYSGASYLNCTNGTGGTPSTLTFADIEAAVKLLRKASAKKFSAMIPGANKFGTTPVNNAYYCYFHTDLRDDIRALDEFAPAYQYASTKGALPTEFGMVDDIRFIETNNGKLVGSTYSNFIVGQNSHVAVDLSGANLNIYRHGFGSAGTADPHNMFMTVGWDIAWTGLVSNDTWMIDLRCIHS